MHQKISNALRGMVAVVFSPFCGVASAPSDRHAPEVAKFRFRLAVVLALRHSLRLAFVWIMVWAAAVVGLRVVFRLEPRVLLWGLVGLAGAVLAGMILAARQTPTTHALRAALDRYGDLGGLLMAAGDTEIGPWDARMTCVPLPAVRWRAGRQVTILLMGSAFLAAAILMPDSYLPARAENVLELGSQMQKLSDQVQLLKQEDILSPDKAEVVQRDLERIRKEALGKDPAKAMEALDHLEQSFRKSAAEAAETAVQQTELASQAQELAAALQKVQGHMDAQRFGEAMKELAQMTDKAAAESQALAENLSAELQEACQQGSLTNEQLAELSKSLQRCKSLNRDKLVQLRKAKLIDGEALSLCDKAGACDPDALAAVLAECENGAELAAALAEEADGLPGRGGISRGRGDAAMTWSHGVEKDDAAFNEKVLPPTAVSALRESRLAGISAGDPTAQKAAGGSTGGALANARAGGGEAHAQTILPEHEKAVQRYFDRQKK